MSFGGFGSSNAFGQNNQQQGSGFGSSGFGGSGTTGGFGSNQTQTNSLFGGSKPSGFGSTATTGGGLFGNNTATTSSGFGSGGFGSTGTGTTGAFGTNTAANTNPFGAKPATGFGTTATTTGTGFGSTGGGFGQTTTTPAFGGGAGAGTAFNGQTPATDGTASTPFNPVTEKDPNSTTNNVYQSISYMQPYARHSFEELRLADYQAGRRFANASGQAGAFGAPAFGGSGFGQPAATGGFGTTGGGFGAAATSAPAFGAQTQTTGGFGASTTQTNSLFGANKPATSLFGTSNTATSQPSLFGANTATTGGFGANTTSTTGTGFGGGSGLFGNQQQQQKPGLFGNTQTTTTGFGSTPGGFGTNTNTTSTTTPFGGTTTTTGFGNAQQPGTTTSAFGSGFGQQAQTQAKPGLFGNTQQQQGGTGLFGSGGTTGTSLFGNQQQQQQQQQPQGTTSLFGGGQTQQTGGTGLFGGAQQQEQKPGLFGSLGTNTAATGTSAFGGLGGNQPAQAGTTSLFGNTQTQQQQKPSLFGNTGGGSMFGGGTTTQPTGSLFGSQTQQQPTTGFGTSMFSTSQQNQQQPVQQQAQAPAPGSFQASLLDGNPYGGQSIFSGLPGQNAPSPGPLATPLSASIRQKQRTPLPIYKLTPNAANRLITPPRRQGYGFSYSTYGSPASASSVSSFSGSLLGSSSLRGGNVNGSFGRSFGKSFSTSNLRKSFDPDSDSVLAPGALTGSASRYSSGSLKRLTIDRSLRNDLFQRPSASPAPITNGEDAAQSPDKLKKRVSFEATTNGALVRAETESAEPTAEELGFLRSIRKGEQVNGTNGTALGKPKKPEMEQARGSELAVVPEAGLPTTNGTPKGVTVDPQPGEYWMKPSRAELSKMSRDQLKQVEGYTVGRQKCGQVTFDRPVDLTTIDLDNVLGGIVQITVRSITVYPDEATKPPRGKGLNVPSTLRIENSWPRGRDRKTSSSIISGPLFDKHVDRLSKVTNTEFVTYEKDTGVWVFRVAHFTTYGLDYEDDEGESLNQSTLSAGPDTPTPKVRQDTGDRTAETTVNSEFDTTISFDDSIADDTFDFKKRKLVPGAYGNQEGQIEGDEMSLGEEDDDGSTVENDDMTGSISLQDVDDVTESITSDVSIDDGDMEMAGSFPLPHDDAESEDLTAHRTSHWGSPSKPSLDLSGDWADQLQRTISPRKQNRDLLREKQVDAFVDRNSPEKRPESRGVPTAKTKTITSSIDLMHSLFAHKGVHAGSPGKKQKGQLKAFELSHTKTPKTFASSSFELSADEVAFHRTRKPRWASKDTLLKVNDGYNDIHGSNQPWSSGVSLGEIDVLSFAEAAESTDVLEAQRRQSSIRLIDSAPFARLNNFDFRSFIQFSTGPERYIWQLVNILFNDEIEDDISAGVPPQLRNNFLHRIKKDRLSRLWETIVREKHGEDLGKLVHPEEVAIAYLTQHRVDDACKTLVDSGNLHLATMLAQIGRDHSIRSNMQKQVESWRQHNVYSEFNEPIRALYELLAGNALKSIGRSSGATEDRASTFTLSERFELDWIQAFGLRLWYSITEDEPLEVAVAGFLHDITTGDEPAFPFPAHLEQELAGLRQGANSSFLESPLWVVLKVYAAATSTNVASDLKVNLPDAISPEAVSGSRLSSRLSFQLHQALATIVGQNDSVTIDKARTDQLTWSYASELAASNAVEPALFVLLHLSRASDRERAIKETLGQFAASLPTPLSDGKPDNVWNYLVQALQLPESWIWVAKGLYARYIGDFANEVGDLIRAKNWNEAHSTFCRVVGPQTIIEGNWGLLSALIKGFGESPDRKVRGWSSGGAVYEDYLRLATAQGSRDANVLKRLIASLGHMGEKIKQTSGPEGLEERVAFMEMSRVVAGWSAREEDGVDLSAILRLPLTGDARVAHTAEIGRRYYSMVMATAH